MDDEHVAIVQYNHESLIHYIEKGDKRKIHKYLTKLREFPITLHILQETKIGKTVNSLRKLDDNIGDIARLLIKNWKNLVDKSTITSTRKNNIEINLAKEDIPIENGSQNDQDCSSVNDKLQGPKVNSSRNSKTSRPSKKLTVEKECKHKPFESIDSECGTSFAEALGMLSVPKKRKRSVTSDEPSTSNSIAAKLSVDINDRSFESNQSTIQHDIKLDVLDMSSSLPSLTPNYRPMPNIIESNIPHSINETECLSTAMFSKNQRTKVYSGNKIYSSKIPNLFELCTRVLMDNIDALEYTGGVPFMILKPILEKCTPEQLFNLEHFNPYLIDDTNSLWKFHCMKDFRTKQRDEMESWREMYIRCVDEREAKLRALTANIKQSQDRSLPVRQTKLAYVDSFAKPPRSIARKMARSGDKSFSVKSPEIIGSSSGNSGFRSNGGPSLCPTKPKKAPLMQKTLALMKGRFRR